MRLRNFCHWQNLNEDEEGNPTGSILKHGRAWFHLPVTDKNVDRPYRREIQFSWQFKLERLMQLSVKLFSGDGHQDIVFCFAFFFFSFYVSFENFLPEKFGYPRHSFEHATGFFLWDDDFRVEFHYGGSDCYECQGYKGWCRHWIISEAIFGEPVRTKREVERGSGLVYLQEGNATVGYPVDVILSDNQWKYPRWPWPKVIRRAEVQSKEGIPIPGKGENSWDCGEDRNYSLNTPAKTIAEAVEAMGEYVQKRREQYGGKNWIPEGL